MQWAQIAELTSPDGGIGDYFGRSVAISGDSRGEWELPMRITLQV